MADKRANSDRRSDDRRSDDRRLNTESVSDNRRDGIDRRSIRSGTTHIIV